MEGHPKIHLMENMVGNHALFKNKAPKPKIVADQERALNEKILWYLLVDKVTNNKKMSGI